MVVIKVMGRSNRAKSVTIANVCFDCGRKYGTPMSGVCGTWLATCDVCNKPEQRCAAPRDFGYLEKLRPIKENNQ